MSIVVGIQDNVIVSSKTTKNDKGSLELVFEKKTEGSLLDAFNDPSQAAGFDDRPSKIILYPFSVTGFGGKDNTKEDLIKEIGAVKNKLNDILLQYMTADKIKWNIFAGTGIAKDEDFVKLTQEGTLKKVYDNLVDQFLGMFTPNRNDDPKRIKFTRQSKAKHYISLPKRGDFIEDMSVPADQSSLKFSKWEVDNGYADGTPVSADSIDDEVEATEESIFNRG